jgi:hypothetical protein
MVGTVSSARQPTVSAIAARIRERADVSRQQAPAQPSRTAGRVRGAAQARATPQKTPDARGENGVPSWKRRIVDELAGELDRRGTSRGSRVRDRLTAENVDARITSLSRELRARAQDRAGYGTPGAARTGVVVNRAV